MSDVEETLAVVVFFFPSSFSGLCCHTHSPSVHLCSGNETSQGQAVPEGFG